MTPELQHAMAQYEDARIQYKKAVLASLNGTSRLRSLAPSPGGSASNGEAIRQAIRQFQDASAELKRHRAALITHAAARAAERAVSELRQWVCSRLGRLA